METEFVRGALEVERLAAAGGPPAWSGDDLSDLELAEQAEERGALDLERGGGATAIAGVVSEGVEDHLALELHHGFVERDGTTGVHGR
jgi:hypothetical protein